MVVPPTQWLAKYGITYITSLNENKKQKIKHYTPGNTCRFEMQNYFRHFKMLTYQSHWEAEM